MLFDTIIYLPDEIIALIWSHLNINDKIFVNKKFYIKYNYLINDLIDSRRYESYLRDIVRNDYAFVFKHILQRKNNIFLGKTNYRYDSVIYSNFLLFLLDFSNKNNSQKCNNLVNLQLALSGLKKKWYKNNRINYNKWGN